jgi:hypothetical protein
MNTTQQVGPVYDVQQVNQILSYPAEQFAKFGKPPDARPGFVTFFDPGWSILRLRQLVADKGIFYPQYWYDNELFVKLEAPSRFRQLRIEAVTDSFGQTFAEQQAIVPPDMEIPSARVVVTAIVIHFLATGERLFPTYDVRCADQLSDGSRVSVGDFDSGFAVRSCWDDRRYDLLGLASSRKF